MTYVPGLGTQIWPGSPGVFLSAGGREELTVAKQAFSMWFGTALSCAINFF